jgi:hypothetical protein
VVRSSGGQEVRSQGNWSVPHKRGYKIPYSPSGKIHAFTFFAQFNVWNPDFS